MTEAELAALECGSCSNELQKAWGGYLAVARWSSSTSLMMIWWWLVLSNHYICVMNSFSPVWCPMSPSSSWMGLWDTGSAHFPGFLEIIFLGKIGGLHHDILACAGFSSALSLSFSALPSLASWSRWDRKVQKLNALNFPSKIDTDGWQKEFLYITLASVAFINVNAAIFQVWWYPHQRSNLFALNMHDFVFKHQYLRVEFWVSLASSHLLIWGLFLQDRFATLWLYLLIPLVMLCSTFRQLVASLQVGPMWSCWRWEPQPQMLPSSALWSGALLKYHKVSSYPWPGSLLSSKGY